MRKGLIGIVLVLLMGCDSDKGLNCFQTAGPIIQETVAVSPFTKINVEERVQLLIGYGPEQKVVIETGENLINDIEVTVKMGSSLSLTTTAVTWCATMELPRLLLRRPQLLKSATARGCPYRVPTP